MKDYVCEFIQNGNNKLKYQFMSINFCTCITGKVYQCLKF